MIKGSWHPLSATLFLVSIPSAVANSFSPDKQSEREFIFAMKIAELEAKIRNQEAQLNSQESRMKNDEKGE